MHSPIDQLIINCSEVAVEQKPQKQIHELEQNHIVIVLSSALSIDQLSI